MGLSLGTNGFGAYELRDNYSPCVANNSRALTVATLLTAVYNNKNGTYYELGQWKAATLGSLATEVRAPSYLGAVLSTTNVLRYGFQGQIYDVLHFTRNLTSAEQIQAEDYLAARNGLMLDRDGDGLPDWWEKMFFGYTTSYGQADQDGDGRTNAQEYAAGSNPVSTDSDTDGVSDAQEFASGKNPGEPDSNFDGYFDNSTLTGSGGLTDTDHNNRPDGWNASIALLDSDGDGMPNGWEIAWGLNPNSAVGNEGAAGNADTDDLTNLQEYLYGTNPLDYDTDNDGLPDSWEIQYGLNPLTSVGWNGPTGDPDGDGLSNVQEYGWSTHPFLGDSDTDGIPDGIEAAMAGGEPNNFNTFVGAVGGGRAGGGGGDPDSPKTVDLKFSISDDSNSDSEIWELRIWDSSKDANGVAAPLKKISAATAGGSASETIKALYGSAYRVRLHWKKSKLSTPDYDYTAAVSIENKPAGVELLIQDPGWTGKSSLPPKLLGTVQNAQPKYFHEPPSGQQAALEGPMVANVIVAYLTTETKNPSYSAFRTSRSPLHKKDGEDLLKKDKLRKIVGINEHVFVTLEPAAALKAY